MGYIIIKNKIREPATKKKTFAGFFLPCSALTPQEFLPNSASGLFYLCL